MRNVKHALHSPRQCLAMFEARACPALLCPALPCFALLCPALPVPVQQLEAPAL